MFRNTREQGWFSKKNIRGQFGASLVLLENIRLRLGWEKIEV